MADPHVDLPTSLMMMQHYIQQAMYHDPSGREVLLRVNKAVAESIQSAQKSEDESEAPETLSSISFSDSDSQSPSRKRARQQTPPPRMSDPFKPSSRKIQSSTPQHLQRRSGQKSTATSATKSSGYPIRPAPSSSVESEIPAFTPQLTATTGDIMSATTTATKAPRGGRSARARGGRTPKATPASAGKV